MLRLKHLLYVEGLTLAGARRKLSEEQPGRQRPSSAALTEVAELLGVDARNRILNVQARAARVVGDAGEGARSAPAGRPAEFELKVAPVRQARERKEVVGPGLQTGPHGRIRDVAQPGSAPDWGSGGRRFESCHPDQCLRANFHD